MEIVKKAEFFHMIRKIFKSCHQNEGNKEEFPVPVNSFYKRTYRLNKDLDFAYMK